MPLDGVAQRLSWSTSVNRAVWVFPPYRSPREAPRACRPCQTVDGADGDAGTVDGTRGSNPPPGGPVRWEDFSPT